MLSGLTGLQESDEEVWGAKKVSFTIQTRSEDSGELVERDYTFTHAKHWDKWTFNEFEERRTDDTKHVTDRNWRRSRHAYWSESDCPDVDVPPEVTKELEELLGLEDMVIQTP